MRLLDVQDLCKQFGGLMAVNGLSLHVDEGEIVGLIGPNGAGKTTAVNLISGLLPRSSGVIRFAGSDISSQGASTRARKGLVRTFQHTAIYYDQPVIENARRATYLRRYPGILRSFLPDAAARERVAASDRSAEELLDMFGLLREANTLAGDLPYGHQKTLGIVLALALKPRLVLLDEPVAGLSAEETDNVRRVIQTMRDGGVSVMVIEHNMRFITGLCDRVVVMAHGQPLAHGKPKDVLRDERVVEAYLGKKQAEYAQGA